MTCYHPVKSLYDPINRKLLYGREKLSDINIDKLHNLGFCYQNQDRYEVVPIDCGKCVGCMLKYRSGWIVRLMSQLYTNYYYHGNNRACFLTLTYDEKHLPYNGDLKYDDVQDFMKLLRYYYSEYYGVDSDAIKYLCCGEYGENHNSLIYGLSRHGRPHYHLILFGIDFKEYFDLMAFSRNKSVKSLLNKIDKNLPESKIVPYQDRHMRETHGTTALRSPFCERIWQKGICVIGNVSAQSCGYVAGYNVKNKMLVFDTKQRKQEYYSRNGENLTIPFIRASKNLGKEFFERFYTSIYNSGVVRVPNCDRSYPIPRCYNKWLEVKAPEILKKFKEQQKIYYNSAEYLANNTPDRLAVREEIKQGSFKKLIRPLDEVGLSGSANEVLADLAVV